jgi:8-oxo-dGTP pyrophosphatase MutT (NUDIX family)
VPELLAQLRAAHPEVTVWAAGGLILRNRDEQMEVLLMYRSRREDWSFPKGKIDAGETLEAAAEREVLEETGFRCRRLDRLSDVRYTDADGREKLVVYWTMEVLDGRFEPNDEVDVVGWFDFSSAAGLLTYGRDVELLGEVPRVTRPPRMPA